jgi:hypothetical protein
MRAQFQGILVHAFIARKEQEKPELCVHSKKRARKVGLIGLFLGLAFRDFLGGPVLGLSGGSRTLTPGCPLQQGAEVAVVQVVLLLLACVYACVCV